MELDQRAANMLEVAREYDAPPELVHRCFLAFVGDPPWSPGFLGVDWWTPPRRLDGAVMDELYAFMRMRVHVIEHVPGRRSVAYVSRWSLPLATRMIQVIETTVQPNGLTRLNYRVSYDPPGFAGPFVPPVQWAFRKWFEASLRGLERTVAAELARSA